MKKVMKNISVAPQRGDKRWLNYTVVRTKAEVSEHQAQN